MPITPTSSRTADARAWLALRLIEHAQNLINDAAQELCDVRGMCPEWEAAARVHDTIKDYWTRVNTRYQSLKCKGPLQLGDADPAGLTSESSRV